MKIGYAKLGRSMPLDPHDWGVVGGDDEPPLLLKTLAETLPEHEFVLVGRNSGEKPVDVGLPSNVSNPWTELREVVRDEMKGQDAAGTVAVYDRNTIELFRDLDQLIVWTGQHGTSNTPIPKVGSGWENVTSPQDAFVNYASYVIRGINAFRAADPLSQEEVWLCPDPRNYLKCRDLKWPPRHPVLGQFNFSKNEKHERYNDVRSPEECGFKAKVDPTGHVWVARHEYVYSRLEVCGVLPDHIDSRFSDDFDRAHFGLFINEARSYVAHNRLDALREYVVPLDPYFVHGKWSPKSLERLRAAYDLTIEPAPAEEYYDKLRSVKCTFTTPSSGSGWATTKPWQAFAVGTVCFFHPHYDTQGHIIPTVEQVKNGQVEDDELAHLALWLRVSDPGQLEKRVRVLESSQSAWLWLVNAQRRLYDRACTDLDVVQHIRDRIKV